jgi:hypothetical protein
MTNNLLTDNLLEPVGGATAATVDIHSGSGNLTIDQLAGDQPVLASGTLEYSERQGPPTKSLSADPGHVTLTLRGRSAGRPWFRFPWDACNGATEWHIHLNPTVSSDITAHTGGGNVKLSLACLAVTRLAADTGGGNMEVVLPDHAANLSVAAKTGGGNVTVAIGSDSAGSNTVTAASGACSDAAHPTCRRRGCSGTAGSCSRSARSCWAIA